MDRRTVLRRYGTGMLAVTAALSGCGGVPGGGRTDTVTVTKEEIGSVRKNTVDGLSFVGWVGEPGEEYFRVTAMVRNTRDETVNIMEYNYNLFLFDADGSEITGTGILSGAAGAFEIGPGEVGGVELSRSVEGTPADVASYELSLT